MRHDGEGWSEAWLGSVVCCVALTCAAAACSSEQERLDALEHEVDYLKGELGKLKAAVTPDMPSVPEPDRKLPFKLSCPAPLRRHPLLGSSLWTCRGPVSVEGVYPQCNVVFQPQVAIEPRDYFELVVNATPQLYAAQKFQSKPVDVHGAPAFEAELEAHLQAVPLKLLGRLMPQGEITYAVTCSAPASSYESYEHAFRQILDSFEWKR